MNGQSEYPDSVELAGLQDADTGADNAPSVDYLELALRYKWLLTLGFLSGLALGIAAYLKLGPSYEATARILVSKKVSVPIKQGQAATYGERGEHIALIMSPMIVGKALQKHHLDKLPSLALSKEPVEDILSSLIVKRSAGHDQSFLNIIDIFYRNPDKKDAETVVAAIIDAYSQYLSDTTEEHSGEVVQLISQANTELLERLRAKEREYLAFRESAPLQWRTPPGAESTASDVTNTHLENLVAVQKERRTNLLKQTELRSKIETLEQAHASGQSRQSLDLLIRLLTASTGRAGDGMVARPASNAGLETQLLPLMIQEKNLLRDFGPDHPKVQAIRKSIETARNFYRSRGIAVPDLDAAQADAATASRGLPAPSELFTAYLVSLRQQLAELTHRDIELAQLQDQESKLAKEFARYQAQDQTYHDDIARIKSLWDVVVRRLNETKLVEHHQGYSLEQIAPVRVELLVKRILKFLGAGLFVCLGAVMAWIGFREWRDTTVKTVDEIQRLVDAAVLGAVPRFEVQRPNDRNGEPLVGSLCYFYRPGSMEAEAYRSIRTTLLAQMAHSGDKVVQISSPEPGDGKTTFAGNLALAIAQTGKSVLLIDADLRRPRTHSLFGLDQEVGVAEVLSQEIDLVNAVKATVVPHLSVLTAGTRVSSPAELLSGADFGQLVATARHDYDVVLVDAAPILVVSDACIVAHHCDGLLMVLQVGKNRRATIKRSVERLAANSISMVGVVANAIEVHSEDGYGYGYGYGANYADTGASRSGRNAQPIVRSCPPTRSVTPPATADKTADPLELPVM